MLDWLALWEIDPWGENRSDFRAVVQAYWLRGGEVERVEYPFFGRDDDQESEDEIIALLEQDQEESDDDPAT